ncbi:hydrophobic protein RCI2A-like [Aegilops tauschii subsp. strangulata]|uniref:Hydrophobic protein OSR8 n=1 Tax=Aegilops tauschii TaxID=37682 RepID=N1QV55_AEGTA|nr:hydrophobic protein RCI2A-like [Aegilops tauschii subsp. strangulata]
MSSGGCSTCLEIIAAVLPPLGVFFRFGCCSSEFFISLLLTVLGYVPGIVYSVYVVLKTRLELPGIDGDRPYYILA